MKQTDKTSFTEYIPLEPQPSAGTVVTRLRLDVNHHTRRKCYYLALTPAATDPKLPDLEQLLISDMAFHNLETAPRFNAKRLAFIAEGVEKQIQERSGTAWDFVAGYAEKEHFAIKALATTDEPPPAIVNGRAEFVTAMHALRFFLGGRQREFVKQLACGEEKQFFYDKMVELAAIVEAMPATYEQRSVKDGDDIVVHLHYFVGGCDWYIAEKDKGDPEDTVQGEQNQAWGLANIGYGGELGYISIAELMDNNAELDFHFKPRTLGELNQRRMAA